MIKSSIRALTSNLSPDLLRLLVEVKLWSPLKAQQHAMQISQQQQCVEVFMVLFVLLLRPVIENFTEIQR